MVAKYYFNDEYRLFKGKKVKKTRGKKQKKHKMIKIDDRNISHFQDRDYKFKYPDNTKKW